MLDWVAERLSAQGRRLQQGSLCFARALSGEECLNLCGPVLVHVFLGSCSVLLGYRWQRCDCLLDHIVPALAAELVLFGTDLQRSGIVGVRVQRPSPTPPQ